jgi:hypothetical protein
MQERPIARGLAIPNLNTVRESEIRIVGSSFGPLSDCEGIARGLDRRTVFKDGSISPSAGETDGLGPRSWFVYVGIESNHLDPASQVENENGRTNLRTK